MNSKMIITAAVIIIVVIAGFGIYHWSSSLTPAPAPTPEPVSPRIVTSVGYIEEVRNITFFTVKGIVENNSTTNIRSVNITTTFYGAKNKTIGTSLDHSALKVIKPQQTAPFEVYLRLGSSTDIPDDEIRYKLIASAFKTDEEPVTGLIPIIHQNWTENGYHRISGVVNNDGTRKAFYVKAICAYYDSEGNVIAMSHDYVSPEIDVNGEAPFGLSSKPRMINPADYELFIVAQHYEPLFIMNYVLLGILIAAFITFVTYMKKYRGW